MILFGAEGTSTLSTPFTKGGIFHAMQTQRLFTKQLKQAYRSRALLGACAYNSTGRKYAPISEMRLIANDIPRIGSVLQFELAIASCYPLRRSKFLEEDCSA